MPNFVQQALAGRPLTVFAGGVQERAFLSASDLARFITEHAEAAFDSNRPIFNVGNPSNTITVWNLAERIVERLQSASAIEHTDARLIHGPLYEEAESIQKLPVLDAAASVGWAPSTSLDELIDETALYYRVRDDAREDQAVPLDPGVRV
jgi:nucleoside-diphosphate-sugar epimerase